MRSVTRPAEAGAAAATQPAAVNFGVREFTSAETALKDFAEEYFRDLPATPAPAAATDAAPANAAELEKLMRKYAEQAISRSTAWLKWAMHSVTADRAMVALNNQWRDSCPSTSPPVSEGGPSCLPTYGFQPHIMMPGDPEDHDAFFVGVTYVDFEPPSYPTPEVRLTLNFRKGVSCPMDAMILVTTPRINGIRTDLFHVVIKWTTTYKEIVADLPRGQRVPTDHMPSLQPWLFEGRNACPLHESWMRALAQVLNAPFILTGLIHAASTFPASTFPRPIS